MEELYHHFDDMMSKTKMYISNIEVRTNGNESFKQYYRIRIGAEDFKERKDLFHIPMGKRSLINSYRYSIPGYPCLYLSTGVEMCWFECGMPKHFSYSAFKLNASDEQPINLINFSIAPVDFISTIVCCYNNCKTCKYETDRDYRQCIFSNGHYFRFCREYAYKFFWKHEKYSHCHRHNSN